jgi:ferrous iron transport protein B
MIGLYVTGIAIGIVTAHLANKTVFRGRPVPFVMEMPNYRFPSLKSVLLLMWEKAKDFLSRAFTVILLATVVIWFLQTFDLKLNAVGAAGTAWPSRQVISPFWPWVSARRIDVADHAF